MRINWFATTALAALVGSGAAFAQAQEPQQRRDQNAAPQAQQQQQKAAPQAQEHRQPGARNAQREESSRRAQNNDATQGDLKKQGNEPARQNAQSEKAPQGTPEQKRASDSRKGNDRNAREETRGHEKQKGQARAREQNPSSRAQENAQENTQKSAPNQNAAQNRQSPDNGKNARQNQAAKPSKRDNAPSTASQADPSKQNNASTSSTTNTASANLSETDRTKVFSRLSRDKTTSRDNLNIQVNVGTRLPSRARPHRLPADIVTIMPQYRGYDYVMVQDEIAIVRPGTREVVDVIHEGGPTMARRGGSTRITLSDTQRQSLLRETRTMKSSQVSSAGPTCLPMQPVPQSIVSQNPDLRGLELIKIGDEAVLVDPKDQKIVDVIRQ